jgi:hypothetical protein
MTKGLPSSAVVALLVLLASDAALAQVRHETFRDSMGRTSGRAVTDSKGNSTFYNALGQQTGRSVTRGNTTTTYDQMGRQSGTARGR